MSSTPRIAGLVLLSSLMAGSPVLAQSSAYFRATVQGSGAVRPPQVGETTPSIAVGNGFRFQVGASVSIVPQVSNLSGPFSWSVSPALPAGLLLNSGNGMITGQPEAAGNSIHTLTVTGNGGGTASASFSLAIESGESSSPIHISYASSYEAMAGSPLFIPAPNVSGGHGAIAFSFLTVGLPFNLSSQNGSIEWGAPTSGNWNVSVIGTDSEQNASTSNPFSLVVYPQLSVALQGTLPSAIENGVAIAPVTLRAEGGKPPYRYFVSEGTLPSGLSFNQDSGVLSGSISHVGSYQFRLAARESLKDAVSASDLITIAAQPPASFEMSVSDNPLSEITAQVFHHAVQFAASGGVAPYRFDISEGALPKGFVLTNEGSLYGVPTVAGDYNFTVRARDSNSATTASDTRSFSMKVLPEFRHTISGVIPTSAIVGDTISGVTWTATGGRGPYTYNAEGELPPGITFSGNSISGTLTTPGSFQFTLTSYDSFDPQNYQGRTYTINVAYLPLSISASAQPQSAGNVGTPISNVQFSAAGGLAPYTYSISEGSLPPGTTLSSEGLLSGTPTVTGSYSFKVRAKDSRQGTFTVDSSSYSMDVAGAVVTVPRPNHYFLAGAQRLIDNLYDNDLGTDVRSLSNLTRGHVFARYAWDEAQEVSCVTGHITRTVNVQVRAYTEHAGSGSAFGPAGTQLASFEFSGSAGGFTINLGDLGKNVKQIDLRNWGPDGPTSPFTLATFKAGRWNGTGCDTPP